MNREQYKLGWEVRGLTRHIVVPEDIERVSEHEPCFRCGQARGCRHRRMAA